MSVSDNAFIQYLENERKYEGLQLKLTQKKIASLEKALSALKRKIPEDEDEQPHPHEEEEEEEDDDSPKTKKPKKAKKPVDGPCSGRVWLNEKKCPGADAKRGRYPERDATDFRNTWFDVDGKKTKKVLCVSCKNEYQKWKKNK